MAALKATNPTEEWPERYRGKPLLILLENYALDVIGALPADKQTNLAAITQRVWNGGADWRATVRKQLGWDTRMDAEIKENWDRWRAAAAREGIAADELAFARAFADQLEQPPVE